MLESGKMWTMAWEDRDIGGQTETLKEREALEDEQKNLRTHWGIEGWTVDSFFSAHMRVTTPGAGLNCSYGCTLSGKKNSLTYEKNFG